MTEWDELMGHPAWQKLTGLQGERREGLVDQLIALGAASTDPKVSSVARHILAIDEILRIPEEEAASERSAR